ncbi:hypothetical protein AX14_002918 [Amanita brunnescens Koide BX004]|nr:hypothetical protein AX14_002918 [Amanita brunnescens Koide BX004]
MRAAARGYLDPTDTTVSQPSMESVILQHSGQKMPLVGFGLWKVSKDTCADTVYTAIKTGYRLLDSAGDYGNEKEAGEGVKRAIKDGIVKRDELFITSKLWNTFHAYEHVKPIVKKQLEDWGLDYFDLYLIHFPIALEYVDPSHRYPSEWYGDDGRVHLENSPIRETWKAMEELVDEGLAKNIGISNFSGSLILDVLRYARIPPQVLQVELHPYLTQDALVQFVKHHSIALTAYSSFGPQSYVELNMGKGAQSLLQLDLVQTISQRHGKTPAQVLLRWATQRGIAVIPKTNNIARLKENFTCNLFDLTDDEIAQISTLNRNLRLNDPSEIDSRLGIFA